MSLGRIIVLGLAAGFLAGCAVTTPQPPRAVTLFDAQHTPVILVSPTAKAVDRFAARELQTYLKKITGREVTITNTATVAGPAPVIVLGTHPLNAALGWQTLSPDQFIIAAGDNRLQIAGGCAPMVMDGTGVPHVAKRGTLYGVYEFLESLGVRWYQPGPLGECVPTRNTITVPFGQKTYRPGYHFRFGIGNYYGHLTPQQGHELQLWSVRMRENCDIPDEPEWGGADNVSFFGPYTPTYVAPARYFASHPEYFALIDGQRRDTPGVQVCLSNPDVLRIVTAAVIALAKTHPERPYISVEEADSDLWCQCAKCRAMDDPQLMNVGGGVSMANRVCKFNNEVARRLAEAVPGAAVTWLAYAKYVEPPTLVKEFAPNTMVWACPIGDKLDDWRKKLDDPTCAPNARFVKTLDGYHALTKTGVYEYFGGYWWPGPMPDIGMMVDRMRSYRRHGVTSFMTQGWFHWGPQGLGYYLAAKLMWNPNLDVVKELELYYRNYYGPAAAPMKLYHETLEQAVKNAPYFGSGGTGLENFFTDQVLAKLAGPIQEARRLARGQQPYDERVAGDWAGYEFARRLRVAQDLKAAHDGPGASRAFYDTVAFFLSFKGGTVFDNTLYNEPYYHLQQIGQEFDLRYPPESERLLPRLVHPQAVQTEDTQWRFQIDPKAEGLAAGWMKPGLDTGAWRLVNATQAWQQQGYPDYHGVAWYRHEFEPPAHEGAQRIVLSFGAVDGDATVFINGEKVGEHALTILAEGWDLPFGFDITDWLQPGHPNLIAVRVKKEVCASGIDQGVKLLRVDKIGPAPAP